MISRLTIPPIRLVFWSSTVSNRYKFDQSKWSVSVQRNTNPSSKATIISASIYWKGVLLRINEKWEQLDHRITKMPKTTGRYRSKKKRDSQVIVFLLVNRVDGISEITKDSYY